MNCFNHPNIAAIALCHSCGRAYCGQCMYSASNMCVECARKAVKRKTAAAIKRLAVLAIIGVAGYYWNFMGSDVSPEKGLSAYLLMSLCTGLFFVYNSFNSGNIYVFASDSAASTIFTLLWLVLKLAVSALVGVLLTPIVILWQIIIILHNVLILMRM